MSPGSSACNEQVTECCCMGSEGKEAALLLPRSWAEPSGQTSITGSARNKVWAKVQLHEVLRQEGLGASCRHSGKQAPCSSNYETSLIPLSLNIGFWLQCLMPNCNHPHSTNGHKAQSPNVIQ